ncbi:hypothetical protein ABFV83_09740 [Lacrimispora sp. BS-2]|uniref:Peptidase C45 hydrolase domain-containing protein n=1 Tax=Lacrimispora sp. BS-2 TaxID=3151850 RepID=A0AAU7PUT3_9FIRM
MKEIKAHLKNFEGTNYEVGKKIGEWVLLQPDLLQKVLLPPKVYPENKLIQITDLLDKYCSGINDEMEEMCFAYTNITGKYKYIGSTLNLFGRCDGMNEYGLAVCKASNGLPVGNFEGGQKAGVTGFGLLFAVSWKIAVQLKKQ